MPNQIPGAPEVDNLGPTSKFPDPIIPENVQKIMIKIDPKTTDGGLWTNGRLMVGNVLVSEDEANDIMRRLDEYAELKAKLTDLDGTVHVREKNKDVIVAKYCADPREVPAKAFSYELGILHPLDWEAQTPEMREYLKSYRKNMYNR